MFSWFTHKCPVSEESRQWVDRRMRWIEEHFGSERVRRARIVLPTAEFFPDVYDHTEKAGERLFRRVCEYAGIEGSRVHLRWITGRPDERDGALFIQSEGGAAGTYQGAADASALITIDRANLRDPMKLVATAAHELCHVHLLGDGHISREEEDHEPLTDLLTIFLGLGIFGANVCVRDAGWSNGQWAGWSVSKLGYLQQSTWGYALAVFARMRGEERPAWAKHLRADVRNAFRASERYILRHGLYQPSMAAGQRCG